MYWILRRYDTPLTEILPLIFLCPAGDLCNNDNEEIGYNTGQVDDASMNTHSGDAQTAYSKTIRTFGGLITNIWML